MAESNGNEGESAPVKQVYGNYEVIKPIGKGKFAVVYRAQRITDGVVVALKRISVDQIDDKAREKCLKEVRLLQSLDHPNVIRYLDSFISENDLVIIVEWAAAGDLKRQLRKALERGVGFEERIIWKYFAQIADAMRHMHEKRIMHRDLKPANIFLTLDGTVKVGDLGLSRELSEHTVQAHSKVGTPLYMSPEVLRGDGYDFKSDVWSLGCILYELAMLKSPFKAEGLNLYGLFQKISAGDFQPVPDNYSEDLRSLVYAMMSARSEDRPEISHVCAVATSMREKFAKLRNRGPSANVADNQPKVVHPTGSAGEEKESRVTQATAAVESTRQQESERNTVSEAKELPSREHSASGRSVRKTDTPPMRGEGEGNFLDDYKFTNDQGYKATPMDDGDAMIRIPSAGSAGHSGSQLDHRSRPHLSEMRPDSKGDRRGRADPARSPGGGRSPTQGQGQPRALVNIDDDSGSSSVVIPAAVKPERSHKVGSGGYSRPDSASRSGRASKSKGPDQYGVLPEMRLGVNSGRENSRKSGTGNSRVGSSDFNGVGEGRPGSRESPHWTREPRVLGSETTGNSAKPNSRGYDDGFDNRIGTGSTFRDAENVPNRAENTGDGSAKPKRVVVNKLEVQNTDHRSKSAEGSGRSTRTVDSAVFVQMNASAELMELTHAKLTVLNFPFRRHSGGGGARTSLTPYHFLCNLSALGGRENVDTTSQFRWFMEVVCWLCTELGQQSLLSKWDLDADSPMLLAKQVLLASQAAGVPSAIISSDNIPPTSLLSGYGEKVCLLLSSLCDCLLNRRNYKFQQAGHEEDLQLEANDTTDGSDDEKVLEELDELEETGFDGGEVGLQESASHTGRQSAVVRQSMIFTAADPVLWKEETERVSQLLHRGRLGYSKAGPDSGWVSHFETVRDFERKHLEGGNTVEELKLYMRQVDHELANDAERIGRFENSIQLASKISSLGASYGVIKQELTGYEEKIARLTKALEEKSASLTELEGEYEEAQDRYNDVHGTDRGEGSSAVVKVKSAIRQIKSELMQLSVREGVCMNGLLGLRVKHQRAEARKKELYLQSKRKPRGRSAGRQSGDTGESD